jgi:hypothetical protein
MTAPLLPDGVWPLIERHLASSRPPGDPAAHLATYAPNGWLIVDRDAAVARDVDPETYLRRRASIPLQGLELVAVEPLVWEADDKGGTLLATVCDEATDTTYRAGFRLSGPPWGVIGGYLETGAVPSPAESTSRVLAEIMAWSPRPHEGVWPMSTLQAAVLRHRPADDEPLLILPESRFTCQGRQHCCQSGEWSIPISRNTAKALSAMPWSELSGPAPALQSWEARDGIGSSVRRNFPHKLQATEAGTCTGCFSGGCSIHAATGWQPLAVCALFPFAFTETPDGLVVSLSYTCPTVAANIGQPVSEQEADLRRRVQPVRHIAEKVQEPIRLTAKGTRMSWPMYRRLEEIMLDWLVDEGLGTVPDRLCYGHWCLSGLLGMVPSDSFLTDDLFYAWLESDPPAPPTSRDRRPANTLLAPMLVGPAGPPSGVLGGGDPEAWHFGEGHNLDQVRDDGLLMRYLREVLFRKRRLEAGLAFQWGLLAWILRVFERDVQWRAHLQGRPIDGDLQIESVAAIDKAVLHGELLAKMVLVPPIVSQMSSPQVWWSLAAE